MTKITKEKVKILHKNLTYCIFPIYSNYNITGFPKFVIFLHKKKLFSVAVQKKKNEAIKGKFNKVYKEF